MTSDFDLTDPNVLLDPLAAYARAREQGPVTTVRAPGLGAMVAVTRHDDVRAVLTDPRFEVNSASFLRPPGIPEHCLRYLRTMSELDGPEHLRLRRLVSPAFTARRAQEYRPRIEPLVDALLDDLPNEVDLLDAFARPLPVDVICELVGVPSADRAHWRHYGRAISSGDGKAFIEAIPAIVDAARDLVARKRVEPGDDVVSDLIAVEGEKLDETELVTLVWHLVLAGQTPANLIGNSVAALLANPDQLATLRSTPSLWPRAVEELSRFTGPTLLTVPRYAREDADVAGVPVKKGDAVLAAVASACHDPRAFPNPDTLDVTRQERTQLNFGHGPHFCLGASVALVETEVALTRLFTRYPNLTTTTPPQPAADPGTWRLSSLPVRLNPIP
ncbi:cytochrome P450 [Actinosynnema sp. NPDC020468]|uniref:cytochrome P450 family protein n=1 Tax=Actinosynnema sp. NPDC020468 TaxID=3154488 RepID=UPI00340305DD